MIDVVRYCCFTALQPIPWPTVLTLLSQIADGLSMVHACDIIHRDVKADNVFISAIVPLAVKLGDLGLSHVLSTAGASSRWVD